jgi:two-component system, sensor histidine kinase and response regulator
LHKTITEDVVVVHRDGHTIPVDIRASAFELNGTTVMLGIFRDITRRKLAEAEMRIAATAFEAQEGIMVTDAQNLILWVNRVFVEITGYSAEEVIGKTPKFLESGRHDELFYREMWARINTNGVWEGEIWNSR